MVAPETGIVQPSPGWVNQMFGGLNNLSSTSTSWFVPGSAGAKVKLEHEKNVVKVGVGGALR